MQNQSERDWWCERRLLFASSWPGSPISEPIAATTGVLMLLIFWNLPRGLNLVQRDLPASFLFVRAALLILAAGTVLFHSISYETSVRWHVNLNLFDWLPLVVTSASFLLLYLEGFFAREFQSAVYIGILSWVLFLCIGMDTDTYDFWSESSTVQWSALLNALLLFPLLATLGYFTYTCLKQRAAKLWMLLLLGMILWLINVYACEYAHGLAFFHGLYHVVMAFALENALCLSLLLPLHADKWQVDVRWYGMLVSVKRVEKAASLNSGSKSMLRL